jgi:hypothetical protein
VVIENRRAVAALLALFGHPYPRKIVDRPIRIENKTLNIDRGVGKFVHGRKLLALGLDQGKYVLDAARHGLKLRGRPHFTPAPEEDRDAVRASQAHAQARSTAIIRGLPAI